MHLITRNKGDVENPKGGVRGVIPSKQNYDTQEKKKLTIEEKRAINKNAYRKWDKESDDLLIQLYNEGSKIGELAKRFERNRWAISKRLEKLGMLEM